MIALLVLCVLTNLGIGASIEFNCSKPYWGDFQGYNIPYGANVTIPMYPQGLGDAQWVGYLNNDEVLVTLFHNGTIQRGDITVPDLSITGKTMTLVNITESVAFSYHYVAWGVVSTIWNETSSKPLKRFVRLGNESADHVAGAKEYANKTGGVLNTTMTRLCMCSVLEIDMLPTCTDIRYVVKGETLEVKRVINMTEYGAWESPITHIQFRVHQEPDDVELLRFLPNDTTTVGHWAHPVKTNESAYEFMVESYTDTNETELMTSTPTNEPFMDNESVNTTCSSNKQKTKINWKCALPKEPIDLFREDMIDCENTTVTVTFENVTEADAGVYELTVYANGYLNGEGVICLVVIDGSSTPNAPTTPYTTHKPTTSGFKPTSRQGLVKQSTQQIGSTGRPNGVTTHLKASQTQRTAPVPPTTSSPFIIVSNAPLNGQEQNMKLGTQGGPPVVEGFENGPGNGVAITVGLICMAVICIAGAAVAWRHHKQRQERRITRDML